MEVPSDWTCLVCWQRRDDVTWVTPCLHQLCYGCAFWWAQKKPCCAVCGHKIKMIRYSLRSDDDYLECSVPQPAAHSGDGLQDTQRPAELVLLPPEHRFPPEVWAVFFQQHPEDLKPLLQWIQQETEKLSVSDWWEVLVGQTAILGFLCTFGLDEAALLWELRPLLSDLTAQFVRQLITMAAALHGPQIRWQRDRRDIPAAGGQNSPGATPHHATFHLGPPASGPSRYTSPAGPAGPVSPEEEPQEEAQEEPGQEEAAGPSTHLLQGLLPWGVLAPPEEEGWQQPLGLSAAPQEAALAAALGRRPAARQTMAQGGWEANVCLSVCF